MYQCYIILLGLLDLLKAPQFYTLTKIPILAHEERLCFTPNLSYFFIGFLSVNILYYILGFDDGFRLLERLALYQFKIPVNLAIQQFQVTKQVGGFFNKI